MACQNSVWGFDQVFSGRVRLRGGGLLRSSMTVWGRLCGCVVALVESPQRLLVSQGSGSLLT